MKHRRAQVFCALCILLMFTTAWAQNRLLVDIGPEKIALGDRVDVTLTVEGDTPKGQPDFTALQQDFVIAGTMRTYQTHIINGVSHSQAQWILELYPKKAGTLTLPSLRWGQLLSPAQTITVANKPLTDQTHPTTQDALLLETNVTPREAYLQQQLTFTTRILSTLDIREAQLSPPDGKHFAVYPEYKQRKYEHTAGDKTYEVIERTYALFPTDTKAHTLDPIRFQGIAQTLTSNGFMRFAKHRKVKRSSDATSILVKPALPNTSGWLPAESLELSQSWELPDTVEVGTPIVRTIKIAALGMNPDVLPSFKWDHLADTKVYADKPQLRHYFDGNNVRVLWQQTITYIPTRAAALTLPGLNLKWFNTLKGTFETAQLVSKQLSLDTVAPPVTPPSVDTETTPAPLIQTLTADKTFKQWHLLIGLSLLSLAGGLGYLWHSPLLKRQKKWWLVHPLRIRYALWRARQTRDNAATLTILNDWKATQDFMGRDIDKTLFSEIKHTLSAQVYGVADDAIDEASLWQDLIRLLKSSKKPRSKSETILPDLF